MNKYINYNFKILSFFGMVFITSGHCLGGGISLLYDWFPFAGFHVALFVFISGYFFSFNKLGSVKHIIKRIKKLFIPLYLWNLFYGLLIQFLSLKSFTIGGGLTLENLLVKPVLDGHHFVYNMGGWFIPSLFAAELLTFLIYFLLDNFHKKPNELFVFVFYVFLGMLGIVMAQNGINTGYFLPVVRFLYFLPFYSLGILYKKLEKYDIISSFKYFSCVFIIQFLIANTYGSVPVYAPSWCNDFNQHIFTPYVVGFTGIAFWLRLSKLLTPMLSKMKLIMKVANSTYSIMINQFLGFMVLKTIFALLSKYTPLFSDFDMTNYKTNIWYYYLPNGVQGWLIVYLIFGLTIPVLMQDGIKKLRLYIGM